MATGYTMEIQNGQDFEDFVLGCSRAFGALVQMRDEPTDSQIPNEIIPSDHHKNSIVECEHLLKIAKRMTLTEASSMAISEYNEKSQQYDCGEIKKEVLKGQYEVMLDKVKQWSPPSIDHTRLKSFMIEQIDTSIEFDCTRYPFNYELLTPKEWIEKNIAGYTCKLEYHIKEWDAEVKRCNERTKWINDLRCSLNL